MVAIAGEWCVWAGERDMELIGEIYIFKIVSHGF